MESDGMQIESDGMPMDSEESFAHDIEQLIEKENLVSMMDLQDIAESDINDLNTDSDSLQNTCYESSWQEVISSTEAEDKRECNGSMTPCPLLNPGEVESMLAVHSDDPVLKPAFLTNDSVDYSYISGCSETETNLDCALSSSMEVNLGDNQPGQFLEDGHQNSSTMHFPNADVCNGSEEANINKTSEQQGTVESAFPVIMDESKGENENHQGTDWRDGSLPTNNEVQGMDDLNGVVPLSEEGQTEESDILVHDAGCSVDQPMVHCEDLGNLQEGYTCPLNTNTEASSICNEENNCPTIDTLVICHLEKMKSDPENTSLKPEFEETVEVPSHGKDSLGHCQLEEQKTHPENTFSNPESDETCSISGYETSTQLDSQKCSASNDEQVIERSSFGFLESCFGLKSTEQNVEESLEHAQVNQCETNFSVIGNMNQIPKHNLFNHAQPPIHHAQPPIIKASFESNSVLMDKESNAPLDPPELSPCQTSKTFLASSKQNLLTENGTFASRVSLSFKTPKRKLQPVVLLKTTKQRTCDGKIYHCFKCQESTQTLDELIDHCHSIHSLHKVQYCNTCECYFSGDTLAGHYCGEFKLKDNFNSSPVFSKTVEKAKFVCRYCGKSFVRQVYYEEHELRHTVVTNHRCERCGLHFPNAQKRQRHKVKANCPRLILKPSLETADDSKTASIKPEMADLAFDTNCSNIELRDCYVKLVDVCKKKQSPEQMDCQFCGKSFKLRAQLKSHLISHSAEKPFKCENCEKDFKYSWNLNKHKRESCPKGVVLPKISSVPGSRFPAKFRCPICFHLFKYSYNRTRHLREQCLKEYMRKGKGKIGMKYRCPLCNEIFTMASNRNRHIKNTCIKFKIYTAKGHVKGRKELEEEIATTNKDKDSPQIQPIHNVSKCYQCTLCPARYTSKSGFYSHKAKHKLLANTKQAIKYKHNVVDLKRLKKEPAEKNGSAPVTCRFCGRVFISLHLLRKHLYLHKGNRPFRCLDCGRNFARYAHLMAHKNVHKRKIQCAVCLVVLPSIGDLLKHRRSHPKRGMLKCPDCPMQFKFPVFLLRHVAVHERRRKLQTLPQEGKQICKLQTLPQEGKQICKLQTLPQEGKQICKLQTLPQEVQQIYKEDFTCALCQQAFADSKALSEHCLTHMPGRYVSTCQFCKRHFANRTALIRHIRLHTGEKPFPCQNCGRHFHRQEAVKVHQEKCTGVQQLPVLQKSNVQQMQAKYTVGVAPDKTIKPYRCSYCPHSFCFPNNLKLHERAHLAKTVFPCPKCGKFYRKRKFKDHERICNGKEFPACRKCGRTFSRQNYRNGHEKHCQGTVSKITGTNGKLKQQCPQCFKSFRSRGFLLRHLSFHSREKTYACMHCGQKYDSQHLCVQHEAFCDAVSKDPKLENLSATAVSNEHTLENLSATNVSKEHKLENLSATGVSKECTLENLNETGVSKECTLENLNATGVSKESTLENLNAAEETPCLESMFSELKNEKKAEVVAAENNGELKCKFCTKSFSRPRSLRYHILTHTEVKPYRCKTCEGCFSRYDYLKVHQNRCRGKQRLEVQDIKIDGVSTDCQKKTLQENHLQCSICSKQLSTPSDLKRHMSMLHITNKPFPCKRCGNTYSSKKTLRRHNLKVRCKKAVKESVQSAKNNDQNQPCRETSKLLQRIQVHYMNKFKHQCDYCPRRFKLAGQLKVHTRLHTGEKPYGCASCGERFIRTDYLKRHLVKCSGKAERQEQVLCDKCGDLFTQGALIIHQKTCVVSSKSPGSSKEVNKDSPPKVKGFSCANCSDRFLLFSQLQQHFFLKHRSNQESDNDKQQLDIFKQEPMDEGYGQNKPSGSQLPSNEQHGNLHKDFNKPFKCSHCHMHFSNTAGLGMHMRIHTGVYPLSCKKCNVGFWTKRTMEKHRKKCPGHTIVTNIESAMESGEELESALNETVLVFNNGSNATGTGVLQTKFSCKDQENDSDKGDMPTHKYQCSECDQSFTDGLRLISHLEEHGREDQERRSGDVHRCHICSKVFSQAGLLLRHVKAQHEFKKKNSCPTCLKSFRCPSDLDLHRSYHDPNRPFGCNTCSLRFWTSKALSIHQGLVHSNKEQSNSNKSTAQAETELPVLYKCHPCDRVYTVKKSYQKHCRMKHKQDSVKTFIDNEPKTSSSQESDMEECNRNASSSQESDKDDSNRDFDDDDSDNDSDSAPYFPCHVCGKTFLTSENLEDHQRCHLGEKPFECEECGKCFFQLVNLQQHQRSHKSEFQCQMCGKGFVSLFALRKHKQTHVRKPPHRCTKCHLSFTRSAELAEHMVTHRDENFPCDLCDKTFSCKTSRAEHRKMHTDQEEELPPLIPSSEPQNKQMSSALSGRSLSSSNVEQYKYRCGICQVRFSDPEQLSEHGCNPAKERPYSCPECNKHFLHGSHLKKHQLSHQLSGRNSYQCNHCSMSFSHHHHYLTHLRSHGNKQAPENTNVPVNVKIMRAENTKRDKIYQCPICPESFYKALELANHLSVHSHMCSVCNMTFPTKETLEGHEKCHLTAATQYECTECGDSFLGSDAFRKHHCRNRKLSFPDKNPSKPFASSPLKKQHSERLFNAVDDEEEEVDVGEDFIICPICQKRFSSNSSLMEHHKNQHDERPFKCLVCGKGFTKKKYLTQHQQIHNERPYKCNVCPESFKTETGLVSHFKLHDTKRQHHCSICNRSYLTANDLSKHQRKHAEHQSLIKDSGNFQCDMCCESFSMLSQLKKHQESHVGQVVYECTECDKAFAFPSLLEEHQMTHVVSTESLQPQPPTHFSYQSPVNE